jgi:hypothetical protein
MPTGASQRETVPPAKATPGSRESAAGARAAQQRRQDHELTVTIPLGRVAGLVAEPLTGAARVLSSRGGLPVYVGLGVLAAADVIAWPVAAAAGLGYAVLRWWEPFAGRGSPPAVTPGRPGPAASPPAAASREENSTAGRPRPEATSRSQRAGAGPARTRKPGTGPRARP